MALLPLGELRATYGSPLLILSEALLEAQARDFITAARAHLPPHQIYYAMKANDHPRVLGGLTPWIDGFEVTTGPELLRLRETPLALASRIVFNGPNKLLPDLELALAGRDLLINIDGYDDAVSVLSTAERLGTTVNVGIRVRFPEDVAWQKFGLAADGEEFQAVLGLIRRSLRLRLVGLHYHGGHYEGISWEPSGSMSPLVDRLVGVRDRLAKSGHELEVIDLGGGFEPTLELDATGAIRRNQRTRQMFQQLGELWPERFGSAAPLLLLEPGRALSEMCMVASSTICNVKRDRGQTFAYVDLCTGWVGGRHPAERRSKYLVQSGEGPTETCVIAGPLCYGSDILGDAELAGVERGAQLTVVNAGAYALSLRFQGPLVPPVILWVAADGQVSPAT